MEYEYDSHACMPRAHNAELTWPCYLGSRTTAKQKNTQKSLTKFPVYFIRAVRKCFIKHQAAKSADVKNITGAQRFGPLPLWSPCPTMAAVSEAMNLRCAARSCAATSSGLHEVPPELVPGVNKARALSPAMAAEAASSALSSFSLPLNSQSASVRRAEAPNGRFAGLMFARWAFTSAERASSRALRCFSASSALCASSHSGRP